MRLRLWVLTAFVSVGLAAPVSAQRPDCGEDGSLCTTTKYGLGHPDDRDFRTPFDDEFSFGPDDFTGSYIFQRGGPTGSPQCGPERNFTPYAGQVLIRERDDCVPTSEGPDDVANGGEAGGCPFEIPLDIPGDPDEFKNSSQFASGGRFTSSAFELISSTSPSFSGTSDGDDPTCLPENVRAEPAQGLRYLLPASRGGDGAKTYLRFSLDAQKGLYRHDDNSSLCCTSVTGLTCAAISRGQFPEYPDLLRRTCALPDRIYRALQTNDWIFDGDTANNPPWGKFETDEEHIIPGQQQGLCRVNRLVPCAVGFAGAVDPCPGLDADPDQAGLQPDSCDLREPGWRNARPFNLDTDGDGIPETPSPDCATSPTVLRGVPNKYCAIIDQYLQPGETGDRPPSGDPGGDCGIWNFGARPVPDNDCDGEDDRLAAGGQGFDFCPFLNEYDPFADTDGDCPGPRCRGDECECGDSNLDGGVDVNDILTTNGMIFDPSTTERLADTTNDLTVNVEDILGTNAEIFVPNAGVCRHVTRLGCGDGIVDPGEGCDDGNVFNNDGCNTACQVE
jgi:cysteine-rich repeat protein